MLIVMWSYRYLQLVQGAVYNNYYTERLQMWPVSPAVPLNTSLLKADAEKASALGKTLFKFQCHTMKLKHAPAMKVLRELLCRI